MTLDDSCTLVKCFGDSASRNSVRFWLRPRTGPKLGSVTWIRLGCRPRVWSMPWYTGRTGPAGDPKHCDWHSRLGIPHDGQGSTSRSFNITSGKKWAASIGSYIGTREHLSLYIVEGMIMSMWRRFKPRKLLYMVPVFHVHLICIQFTHNTLCTAQWP